MPAPGWGLIAACPTFAANHGFWRAYPPYERLGLDFVSLANPRWFAEDPTLAWGFYGHRMELYRRTDAAPGLRNSAKLGRAGCDRADSSSPRTSTDISSGQGLPPEQIVEVHGSFEGMQCTRRCGIGIFPGELGRGRDRSGDDAGSRALAGMPRVWRPGAAEYLDVR